jgi:hypothetical protein
VLTATLSYGADALAQRPGPGQQQRPTQTGPTVQKQTGPRNTADDDAPVVQQRVEPTVGPPQDPLAISPEVRARIGSDWDGGYASPRVDPDTTRGFNGPFWEERRGDYRLRLLPPFVIEQTRGLADVRAPHLQGIPSKEDTEGLYGLFYYRRRSPTFDADVVFPLAWRVRDNENHVMVLGPGMHREAPGENDNWLAPLFFQGSRPDGGYLHIPALLATSSWSTRKAFTLVGPYFRDRTGADVDTGVAPFFFRGDNGNIDGDRRTYTLIPPLLYYHRDRERDDSTMTVVGPLVLQDNPKRNIFDVLPFFFHIKGKPETGGVAEEHTTLFPFFHWGHSPEKSLFIVPGYMRRMTRTTDTMITPLYSHAETRNGGTSLTAVGPVLPIYWRYKDRDLGVDAIGILPFYYQSDGPVGHDFLTPLFGKFETYGVSKTYWAFPSITVTTDTTGWSTNVYPIAFVGREKESSHTVLAPLFWDFANPKKRTTIAFPFYWRFAETADDSVTQLAGNTLYLQKKVAGGTDWSFHFLPLFSYGENPRGYFWNFLFGMVGYTRDLSQSTLRAFWIPIPLGGGATATGTLK